LLRLAIAGFLLYAVVADTGPRLARLRYAAMPDFDYCAEVSYLRQQGRFGEALVLADAGLTELQGEERSALLRERETTARAQSGFLRRAKDLGMGAISGRGASLEGLIGAITTDFFVVGDIRDVVLQGGRLVLDGETDEVILVLSGIGLATTLAPEVDWVPAVLKAAKKSGALSKRLGEHIVRAARAGRREELVPLFRDVRRLSERASPGGAVRILRHADSPEEVALLARFVDAQPSGAFALHISGKEGAGIITGTRRLRGLPGPGAEAALLKASRKGAPGIAWLRGGGYRAMIRPHLLVGIGKAFWKGNSQALAARIAETLDPRARWLIPALAAWVFVELGLLARRLPGAGIAASARASPA
jgi:hypothetical protein